MAEPLRIVGRPVPRIDGFEKVTGRARYAVDLAVPGMIHGALLRSPLPHARIRAIDTSKAKTLPGVVATLTRDDVGDLDPFYGPVIRDRPLIALDAVRYVGEPVVGVAALDAWTAWAALELIDVTYEEIPSILDMEAAMAPGAPLLHEDRPAARGFPPVEGNVCFHARFERGDVAAAFARAARIFEHTFTFPMVYHYAMEPHAVIASVDGPTITVWSSAQHPFLVRAELARVFGRSLEQVRVIVPYVGGGFGSKSYTKIEPLVVALARKAGRPVRVALSVTEACHTTRRHSARIVLRSAVDAEDHLVAREATIWLDTGAYADNGPRVAARAATRVLGAYKCPHVRVDALAVYTNSVPAGSFRSIGGPQATWAGEAQMTMMARALGRDPLEFRVRNLHRRGETIREGERPLDADLEDGLRRVAAAIGWDRAAPAGVGRGLALGITDAGAEPVAAAIVRLHHDGSASVHESSTEIGQGVRTVLAQIAAEELALPIDRVGIVASDTGSTPYDRSTGASRSTTLMGLAVQKACLDVRAQLAEIAAGHFGVTPADLAFEDGRIAVAGKGELTYPQAIRVFFGAAGGELIGRGYVRAGGADDRLRLLPLFWEVGWGAAEVAVDEETGMVRILRYASAADVGTAVNPALAEGQDEGAAVMGVGHTLYEALTSEGGQLLNANLIDYRVPLATDLPEEFHTILVQARNGPGAYDAKGMGEGAINPVAPAVAAGLAEACGVWITDLPLTPERVWRALRLRAHVPAIRIGEGGRGA